MCSDRMHEDENQLIVFGSDIEDVQGDNLECLATAARER